MTQGLDMSENLIELRDLRVAFNGQEVVHGIDFDIRPGECLALVGESGSGKSVTAHSILQLLDPAITRIEGSIRYAGEELLGVHERYLRQLRGNRIAMIFQEPMSSLNPLHTIERQLGESLALHKGLAGAAARKRILELLELVGIQKPRQRLKAYPHQLSGGQRQRVMIAMALACEPQLLIADEPTTALDVTVQRKILLLLKELQQRLGMALLIISHDLNLVRNIAQRVAVMRDGVIVEQAPCEQLFSSPQHPYSVELLNAEPGGEALSRNDAEDLLEVRDLKVHFRLGGGWLQPKTYLKAVDGIDLNLQRGKTLGIVGESGSGKSTLGQAILRLIDAKGSIRFQGEALEHMSGKQLRPLRKRLQVVFQDPFGSLSPRLCVEQIIAEGLRVREQFAQLHRQHHVAFSAQFAAHEGLHAVGFAADDAFQRFAIHHQRDLCIRVFAFLQFAGLVFDDQREVLGVVDTETEHQVQARSGFWVELGFHRLYGIGYGGHGVILYMSDCRHLAGAIGRAQR
jgi:microcin C transport system ATP-binding protein